MSTTSHYRELVKVMQPHKKYKGVNIFKMPDGKFYWATMNNVYDTLQLAEEAINEACKAIFKSIPKGEFPQPPFHGKTKTEIDNLFNL